MSLVKFEGVKITNAALIAGFFKEALFFSRGVQLVSDGGFRELFIEAIEETSSRANGEERKITLRSSRPFFVQPGSIFEFNCVFPHLTASWKGELSQQSPQRFVTRTPKQLRVTNLRHSLRLAPLTDRIIESTVLVNTADLHCEGRFLIDQISVDGMGGTLVLPPGMKVGTETSVTGKVELEFGSLSISGKLIHARLLGVAEVGDQRYQVGIQQANRIAQKPTGQDRRKNERLSATLKLDARSPLHPSRQFTVDVLNASVTGFAARLPEASARPFVPIGASLCIEDSTLLAEVVEVTADQIRFQIIDGSPSDRLAWVKRLAQFKESPTETRSAVGFDLVSLFCQSGALAAQHIKNQREQLQETERAFAFETGNEGWVHRWIERTSTGDVRGHVCAILMGDNLWHLGEIAGSPIKEQKVSSSFIPKFFSYMREYALSCSPCPKVVIAWNLSHKYWTAFQNHLEKEGRSHVRSKFVASYVRANPQLVSSADAVSAVKISEITPTDYSRIEQISSELQASPSFDFLCSLGFGIDNFGSPNLRALANRPDRNFQRIYVVAEHSGSRVLAVLSAFPSNSSLNRTFDVAWVFSFDYQNEKQPQETLLLDGIKSFAVSRGLSIPGFLIPRSQNPSGGSTKLMQWMVCHPDALRWFSREQKA